VWDGQLLQDLVDNVALPRLRGRAGLLEVAEQLADPAVIFLQQDDGIGGHVALLKWLVAMAQATGRAGCSAGDARHDEPRRPFHDNTVSG
jgi:hypothetical protein